MKRMRGNIDKVKNTIRAEYTRNGKDASDLRKMMTTNPFLLPGKDVIIPTNQNLSGFNYELHKILATMKGIMAQFSNAANEQEFMNLACFMIYMIMDRNKTYKDDKRWKANTIYLAVLLKGLAIGIDGLFEIFISIMMTEFPILTGEIPANPLEKLLTKDVQRNSFLVFAFCLVDFGDMLEVRPRDEKTESIVSEFQNLSNRAAKYDWFFYRFMSTMIKHANDMRITTYHPLIYMSAIDVGFFGLRRNKDAFAALMKAISGQKNKFEQFGLQNRSIDKLLKESMPVIREKSASLSDKKEPKNPFEPEEDTTDIFSGMGEEGDADN